ncbi:GNAT family N-acetyltransferase [Fructilactobacillus hinvesii]|uniref:GNAT family N-acetyltransferase n=1 Tax=Fructilactobacillus hinvesii TaxID=2940300 RepID=A0ABY5BTK2_9LACO|nr:GNAT family N-acetyltransferase [Fructilactobacillus hinvesii]USS87783.1 GNAT family N-acetyltransferase [Fructilactobacillus hinvesii]
MSDEVQLRAARATDATALLTLVAQLRHETKLITVDDNLDHQTPAAEAAALERLNASGTNLVVVAALGAELIGLVTITQTSSITGELGIAVLNAYQGLGLGSALLEMALDWFETQSQLSELVLTVKPSNTRAQHLYHQAGFQTTATTETLITMHRRK